MSPRTRHDEVWTRRGFTLLWGADALHKAAQPSEILSIRQFFELAKAWPEELPSSQGNAVVVTGLEGCLDLLKDGDEAAAWIEGKFKDCLMAFQNKYENQAALIFWLPSARNCIKMHGAHEEYYWNRRSNQQLHLGRLLWSGAESEVERIIDPNHPNQDADGPAWIALYHPRIS
ncbi:MAG: hypothetical protein ABIK28_18800 [Planctomycetota bacterium]